MVLLKVKEREGSLKNLILFILLSISIFLQLHFQIILKTGIIFSHFFYIPIILACFWWKRNGLVIPAFLALLLIIFPIFIGENIYLLTDVDNLLRALLLISVGIVVAILSEHISKTENKLKEQIGRASCRERV